MTLLDNTVLSNFALAGQFSLLRIFCTGRGLITRAVEEEFGEGVKRGLFSDTDISWLRKTDLRTRTEVLFYQQLLGSLNAGEASCLSIAVHRGHDLLTDDLRARHVARREGLRVSGSVGVLVSLVKHSDISLDIGNQVLKTCIERGYYSPVQTRFDLKRPCEGLHGLFI